MRNVAIIGAGLAGSLLAIYLAKRGMRVDVYESRGDMRTEEVAAGRSINLALSDRGIAALREIGMDEYMLTQAVPMYGRMIHSVDGKTKLLPYSGRQGEYINSVSRAGLNIALINEAEKYENVQFVFNERCTDLDVKSGEAVFASGRTRRAETMIATDGAGSVVRQSLERQIESFEASSVFLEHGYKELHIPPSADGGFQLEKNALHIWPRHQFMMIALPNFDGSFTCTLFLDKKEIEDIRDAAMLKQFFSREFPDALELMPTLEQDFFENPTGELGTLKCWPWAAEGKVLLLGDAAHAMVPFYGQGMNCAFEDVRILAGLIDASASEPPASAGGQVVWESIFDEYGRHRKINTDAIADMAQENFFEMRDATADPVFHRKRELETKLEQNFDDYFSKYSMVTFREDLPYSLAKEKGQAQDALLMSLCAEVENVGELDLNEVMSRVRTIG